MTFARSLLAVLALGSVAQAAPALSQPMEQFVPIAIYRTGPYASGGSGIYGAYADYLALVNERDGGVNGVKLVFEECETAYQPDRMIECYERLKNKGPTGAAAFAPSGTGSVYALIERMTEDKIPSITLGYGRTDASDGRVFPYMFTLIANYWTQNTATIRFIAEKEGGFEKLKGKKIANVLVDFPSARETGPVLEKQAGMHGFEVRNFPIAPPGLDQRAVWLQVRQYRPDWILFAGWGSATTAGLKEAARVAIPRDRMIGWWWSGSEEDVTPAGDAAKGFITSQFHATGQDFPVFGDIRKFVYEKGKGNVEPNRIGSVYYVRGVLHGVVLVEGMRTAMARFGNRPLTGDEVRWGLENMEISPERLRQLGIDGLMPPLKVTCADHEGGGGIRFQQWDGGKWAMISDWVQPDPSIVRPMVEASAAQYAREKGITPRDCGT
ncbi:ABC transporter substrate-binding protein [Azospirillum sp. RWY-5-1]|uniref:ABC transporter substrate-binding protein n=2 Tax=Azospirillum oleiclasticum TaxID=2735135 RepID=A0ABX2TJB4_9PROT|nr:ABC transporter substrate-binding protein [Azospirillum oleiclasticum]NYZ14391.1 ABC transporter substrate-binding protein [Azospirillum oleiclasticum]NYZ23257.1 ABC transporter substrate-binding protein [Azospirillum oleiclasticum]